ncbi:LysR family transcriptional regulator [Celerinatantimonas sp. MCCC 1A17872]|uniref:LysR family transcriptional regulator n=1 Tax=Celerinatantimonas sp. MCCC 1A17872 TaxID=3177514 RepID=UPI0038C594A9
MLNPVWLTTFKTLVEVGHFTRTAEALNMTQPGVSQHIHKLEDACGYPLVKRFNKSFELTSYGQKVYQYACKLMKDELALLKELGHDEPYIGKCSIGCSGTLAWLIYPKLLSLQARFPDLSIEIEASPNQRIFEQISIGMLDIGFATKEPNPKYFDSRIIGKESLVFVLPITVSLDKPLDILLTELGVICHPDLEHYFQTYVMQSADAQLSKLDLDEIPAQSYINQVHQILEPIAKGIGFTVVPKCCVDLFAQSNKLQILDVPSHVKEPVYLVTKRHLPLPRRYDQVIALIKSALKQSE